MKTVTLKPSHGFEFDKAKDGWELVENVECLGTETLELAEFLHKGESYVGGDTMLARAKDHGNRAGQLHAEQLLRQQDEIPAEWREYYLVFSGTIWRHPHGNLCVPCLYWTGRRWFLDWAWLECSWGRRGRLVRFCK